MEVASLVARLSLDATSFVASAKQAVAAYDALESRAAAVAQRAAATSAPLAQAGQAAAKAALSTAAAANRSSEALAINERKVQGVAAALVSFSGTNNVATQSLFILASAAEVAGKSLAKVSVVLVGIAAVGATVQIAKDFIALGTTSERYLETLGQIQEAERTRLAARAAVIATERSATRDAAQAAAEAAAIRRKADDDEISAIRIIARQRAEASESEEKDAIARVRAAALTKEGRLDTENAEREIRNKYRNERVQLEAAADAEVTRLATARTQKELAQEQAITDVVTARYEARAAAEQAILDQQLKAAQAALDAERGRKNSGALPGIESLADAEPKLKGLLDKIKDVERSAINSARFALAERIRQIDAETKKDIAAQEDRVQAGELAVDRFLRFKAEREESGRALTRRAETELSGKLQDIESDRIKSVDQEREAAFQRQLQRSQLFQNLARAASQSGNEAAQAVAAGEDRIAEVVAYQSRARLQAVEAESEDRTLEIQKMVRDGVLTEEQGARARLAVVQSTSGKIVAALAAEAAAKRQVNQQGASAEQGFGVTGGFLQGKTKIDDFVSKSNALVQAFAQAVASGTPLTDIIQDIQRDAEAAAKAYDKLATEFKGSPALLAELEKRASKFRFGDIVQQVRDSAKSIKEITTNTQDAANAVVPLTNELSINAQQWSAATQAGLGFVGMLVQVIGSAQQAIPVLRELDALLAATES